MMNNPLELILDSCVNFSIPVWALLIVVMLTCWLFYWDKYYKLRIIGKPRLVDVTYSSITIEWDKPASADPSHYIVYYKKTSEHETWDCITTMDNACSLEIAQLQINTKFVVKVCACSNTERGPTGDESNPITTKNLAYKMKDASTLRRGTTNNLSVYDVPFHEEHDNHLKIRTVKIGESPEVGQQQTFKRVLMLSDPHSEKTTLLQGIMNFIVGVSYDDDFRLGFAQELLDSTQEYQDWTTVYQFVEYEGGKVEVPVMLIDIPITEISAEEHLKKISDQLILILKPEERRLHRICFVFQANDALNEQIKNMKSVERLFISILTSNVKCFITLADSSPAHFKEYLKFPYVSHFVNCSAFSERSQNFSLLWKSTTTYFDDFFKHLETEQKAMRLCNIIPDKIEELKSDLATLRPEVKEDLIKLGEIKFQVKTYEENRDDILLHGNLSFTIDEIIQTKIDLPPGKHVTNCLRCSFICHDGCAIADDKGKKGCVAMDDGFCTVCVQKCEWWYHKNIPYFYEYKCIHVTKSYQEMKSNYEQERGVKLEFVEYLEKLTKDISELLRLLHGKVKKITDCQNEMQHTEETPDKTIDDMIKTERKTKDLGFERRIEMYEELKEYSNMIRIRKN